MIAVSVTCDNGNNWVTSINGTYEEAADYFMGKTFVRETLDGHEIRDTVVSVLAVPENCINGDENDRER